MVEKYIKKATLISAPYHNQQSHSSYHANTDSCFNYCYSFFEREAKAASSKAAGSTVCTDVGVVFDSAVGTLWIGLEGWLFGKHPVTSQESIMPSS